MAASTPRIDTIETKLTTKWQKKALTSDSAATNIVAALAFNNLEIGKTYKATANVVSNSSGASVRANWQLINSDSAATNVLCVGQRGQGTSLTSQLEHSGMQVIFVATNTNLNFEVVSNEGGNTTFLGDANQAETYVILEELPDHEITTDWT